MPLSLTARYGLHRVLDGDGTFPQPAWKLDADPRISDAEILVDVERLNLDSASFRQLASDASGDPAAVARAIEGIVAERGKLHNPATGSGGMLVGTVREVGSIVRESRRVVPGQRIASLISLTLTPLRLDRIDGVEMHHGQVDACGTAVLFELSPAPDDIPERIALAALDVAGAPSRTAALVRPGDTVVLVGGGGTAGLLTLHEARKHAGPGGTVVVTDLAEEALEDVRETDVAVNLVNVPGTELGTILVTRESGTILFFSMATSFATAALGAEGLGRATTMLIGNGHMPDMGLTV